MNVTALVTLYYPDKSVVENVRKLYLQVDNIILLDNTPYIDNSKLFIELNVRYIPNFRNLGLSAAFNSGFDLIKEKHVDYIVFFDQDSQVNDGHIKVLVEDFVELSKHYKIGCIGPSFYDRNSNKLVENMDRVSLSNNLYSVKSLITSSLLTTPEIFKDINGWNEKIFLDYADWDFCWRMLDKSYLLVQDGTVVLNHSLGDSAVNIGKLSFPKYSPIREYYRIRDCLKLFKKKYVPFKYKLRFIYTFSVEPFIYLILFPDRVKRVRLIFRAFKDFFFKIDGCICD